MSQAITTRQLDARAVLQYKEEGLLIVRGVFTADEISALDAEAERLYLRGDLIDTDNIRCRWQNQCRASHCRSGVVCRSLRYVVSSASGTGPSGADPDVLADAPQKARQFTGDRHADLVVL